MIVKNLSFGSITIDGEIYVKDVIIDNGLIKKRKKAESKKYSDRFGHTLTTPEPLLQYSINQSFENFRRLSTPIGSPQL